MPPWVPRPEWQGEDAYIIGGGPSLRDFDWGLLRGRNTIGCNGAYKLGGQVVKIVVWGDLQWWEEFGRDSLPSYGGRVVGCSSKINRVGHVPWLLTMERFAPKGLSPDRTKLAWGSNTGVLAINLALHLGARRVYLLGFDMKLAPNDEVTKADPLKHQGRANWHDERYQAGAPEPYERFKKEYVPIAKSLPEVFPGCSVINVHDDSALKVFPMETLAEHFERVPA